MRRTDPGTSTLAALPPGAPGCGGIPVNGPGQLIGRINALCLGCLRYQGRTRADRLMTPQPIARGDGTYYCAKRIGA